MIPEAFISPDFRTLFEALSGLYLVLLPDAPRFTIVAASDAYLQATLTRREAILGRGLFDIFPDNPADPGTNAVSNTTASLYSVLQQHTPHTMTVQKHDIQRSESAGGGFEERYWSPVNSPVLGAGGELLYILHCVEDITEFIHLGEQGREEQNAAQELQTQTEQNAARSLFRSEGLREDNSQLRKMIAERKLYTEAIRVSEDKYRKLLDTVNQGYCHCEMIWNTNGHAVDYRFLEINSAFEQMTGLANATGKTVKELVPTFEDWWIQRYAQVLQSGEAAHFQHGSEAMERVFDLFVMPTHNSRFVVLFTEISERIRREQEKEALNIRLYQDIQERKAAEAALQESEARYRFLADFTPQIVWTSRPDGNLDYYNRRWFEYTGMTQEEARDWGWKPVIHPDDLADCIARWTHSFTTGEPYEVEFRVRRASDGIYRWHLSRALPRYSETGEIIQWVGTCTDIDDFKQAQTALLQINEELEARLKQNVVLEARVAERTEELVRSNADLQQFAYVASHDLQEPLRMVASFVQLLEKTYKGKLDGQADLWIDYAVDGAARMQTLISDLLAYSRVGTHGEDFQICDLKQVFLAALKNLAIAVAESNAEITCDVLPVIAGDEAQLVSLFQNLIGNAIKYRGEPPPRIHITARPEGEDWLFSVRDNGIGIAPEFSERIFIIFQRLHNRTKYPGTGIGLALCKRIIERHGGHIWMESEPGNGTTFFFRLPRKQKQVSHDETIPDQVRGNFARGG